MHFCQDVEEHEKNCNGLLLPNLQKEASDVHRDSLRPMRWATNSSGKSGKVDHIMVEFAQARLKKCMQPGTHNPGRAALGSSMQSRQATK